MTLPSRSSVKAQASSCPDVMFAFFSAIVARLACHRREMCGLIVAAAPILLTGCGETSTTYRMTATLLVDGRPLSASALQAVHRFNTGNGNGEPVRGERTVGVAAIADLGRHGMLAVGGTPDWNAWRQRREDHQLSCPAPRLLNEALADQGGRNGTTDSAPRQLSRENLPAFVWFPYAAPATAAVQICPEEFARIIGPSVRLVQVTVQEVPDTDVPTRLTIRANWLDDLRGAPATTRTRRAGAPYVYSARIDQFEMR